MSARIKILDQPPPSIILAPMPHDQAQRWSSPYEPRDGRRVEIFFAQPAFLKCVEHAASDLDREVGGVLIGQVRLDSERAQTYLIIQNILPARHIEHSRTHVTFTQDTLVALNTQLTDDFPGKRIVGWYHTHPHLDIFLSSYDAWLHRHFFNDPTQVALVIEPCSERGGFFVWGEGHQLDTVHYVGFFELGEDAESSVVTWTNLTAVLSPAWHE
jgi:proteasome lid subunit RPN8/RPN11